MAHIAINQDQMHLIARETRQVIRQNAIEADDLCKQRIQNAFVGHDQAIISANGSYDSLWYLNRVRS